MVSKLRLLIGLTGIATIILPGMARSDNAETPLSVTLLYSVSVGGAQLGPPGGKLSGNR